MIDILKNIIINKYIYNDAPLPWTFGFQDGATPGLEGIVNLHNTIFFFIVIIFIGVLWMLVSITFFFKSDFSKIVHKYWNHGKFCADINIINNFNYLQFIINKLKTNLFLQSYKNDYKVSVKKNFASWRKLGKVRIFPFIFLSIYPCIYANNNNFYFMNKRLIHNSSIIYKNNSRPDENLGKDKFSLRVQDANVNNIYNDNDIKPIKIYKNFYEMKIQILEDNTYKSGIYKFSNNLNGKSYVGSSINLKNRFLRYYNYSYISFVKNELTISRALIKYGYLNFSLEILEYCETINLLSREQFYLDLLKPEYNIAKIAGSTLGIKLSEERKKAISVSLKGKYCGELSKSWGRKASINTRLLMSSIRKGENNPMFGKKHNKDTLFILSQKKLGSFHTDISKKKMSEAHGKKVFLYESVNNQTKKNWADLTFAEKSEFYLKHKFVSYRETGRFLSISQSTVSRYISKQFIYKKNKFFSLYELK